ncbi:hypothetical protein QBC46DRAFT_388319 [Diplogelasinospora grovesii]|uniref:Actin-like ATPase domain-containing protein n=1 Tax=Diplogelasinospora grovesii TaxID=303347 RepID=A0AAN6N7R9_9PEZI|nr:hypothetical protein QBC46DRAFT_388319 [Diplogelasinospora grovesii]
MADSPPLQSSSPVSSASDRRRNFARRSDGSPRLTSGTSTPSGRPVSPPSPPPPSSPPAALPAGEARVIIALDYGTTFTGIAYLSITGRHKELDLDTLQKDTRVLQAWPTHESEKVPSEYSYSPSPKGCRQWGYDIDDNSRVLKWTKLELEETKNRTTELRTLAETLYGLRLLDLTPEAIIRNDIPRHLAKEPEDIVKEYLDQIAEQTFTDITTTLGRHVPERLPIDMVVTHPAKWSDRALNSTYRAVRAAFNPDIFPTIRNIQFVTEPEACAHYTLQVAQTNDNWSFRKNDCFIVVDAGGGTVDLASYKVLSVDHDKKQIKLAQVGVPIGDKCGATCIDRAFNDFLKERLGDEDYDKLTDADAEDHATGGHSIVKPKLRAVQSRFEPIKHGFDGKESKLGYPVQLPRGIGTIDNEEKGIMSGAIKVTTNDLRLMFKDSVERTLYLIAEAATQIEIVQKLKVKKIFLSGGFAKSQYLFDQVKQFGQTRRIDVERGGDCWIAVAKGAILKSLGVYTDKPLLVGSCPRHYGIKVRTQFASYKHQPGDAEVDVEGIQWATDQIRWFIQKGDALIPKKSIVATYDCHWSMKASDFPSPQNNRRTSSVPQPPAEIYRDVVFVASAQDEAPGRFAAINRALGDEVMTLRCDLTKVPRSQMGEFTNQTVGKFLKFWVKVEIHVLDKVTVKITSGGQTLTSQDVSL